MTCPRCGRPGTYGRLCADVDFLCRPARNCECCGLPVYMSETAYWRSMGAGGRRRQLVTHRDCDGAARATEQFDRYQRSAKQSKKGSVQMSEITKESRQGLGSNPAGVAGLGAENPSGFPPATEHCSVVSTKSVPDDACSTAHLGGAPVGVPPSLPRGRTLVLTGTPVGTVRLIQIEDSTGGVRYEAEVVEGRDCLFVTVGHRDSDSALAQAMEFVVSEEARRERLHSTLARSPITAHPDVLSEVQAVNLRWKVKAARQRGQLVNEVIEFLKRAEADWEKLADISSQLGCCDAVTEAKAIHDAQMAELFAVIGGAL